MKRKSLLILLPIAAMAFAGCTPVAKPCSEAKITIPDGKQLVNIKKGENAVLEYQISDDNCKKEIAWSTTNPAIATVSNGVVTGVGVGTVTIKANDGVSWTVVVTDLPKPVAALDSITVFKAEANYKAGEFFDKANAIVLANYSDGTSKQVTTFDVDKNDALTVDDKVVVFSYTEGSVTKTVNFSINVTPNPSPDVALTSISITKLPTKVDYFAGEEFDPAGLEVTAHYSDGNSKVVTENLSFNKKVLALEDTKVVVTYTEGVSSQSADIDVNVTSPSEVTLVRIEITKQPTIKEYFVGDTFSSAGLEVTAHYSNNTSKVVEATCSAPDMSTKGPKTVIVSYTEGNITKTDNFQIIVMERGSGHAGTLEDPLTTAEAVVIANGLPETTDSKNPIASEGYYVKGVVTEFKESFSANFGNYSIVIGGDFTLWRIKNGPDFAKFNDGDIEVGDEVIAFVYIMNFKGTPESTSNSYVHSVQKAGDTKVLESIEIVGSLTKSEYVEGQTYSAAGLSVKGHYDDGSEGTVAGKITLDKTIAVLGDTELVANATFGDKTAQPRKFEIVVTEKIPVVGGAVYTFVNDKTSPQNWKDIGEAGFMKATICDGGEIITGYSDGVNAYIGGNGGQNETAWNIWNSLKIGKSNEVGEIKIKLDTTATFEKIKMDVIGNRDDGTLTVNGVTQNVTKKATKDNLDPMQIEFDIEGGVSELALSSKSGSGNFSILITKIEFVGGDSPTPQKQLTDLTVKSQPSKVNYNEGETFNPDGMVLTATYSDGSTQDITTGWTIAPNRALTASDEIITVSFGGKSVTIAISVTARELISIAITSGMSKTKYYVGDSWSSSGVVVTGTYNIGDPAVIDSSEYSLTYDPTAPALGVSEVSIVASMNDGSMASQAYNQSGIVVEEKQQGASYNLIKSNDDITEGQYLIVYDTKSYKGVDTGMNYATVSVENESIADDESLIYVEFEEMTGGFALKVVGGDNDGKYMYGSSSKNTIGFDANKKLNTVSVDDSGNATIVSEKATFKFNTISGQTNDRFRYYKPLTTPNADQVLPSLYKKGGSPAPKKQISGVEIQGTLAKSSYVAGQTFDPTGLSLKVSYDDGTDETVTSGFTFDAVNPLAVGEFDIKATYKGCESSNSVHISVVAKAITALEIKSGMSKISYVLGEDWAPAGIVVEATYNDGSKANLQSGDYTLEFDPTEPALEVEEVSIVAKAANGITSAAFVQNVSVTEEPAEVTLTGIAASGYTNTATVGQTYTFDGTVTASYSDGSSHAVTGYTWTTAISTASAGEKTGVISYTEGDVTKTCNVVVTVAEAHENTVKIAYEAAVPKTSGATDPLTFTGVVSAIQGNSFVVADGDYGILIYNYQVSGIDVGKTITVKATLKNYKGLIESDSVTSATLGAAGTVPTPVNVTSVSQLNGLKTNVLINCVQLEVVSKESTWSSSANNNWNVKLAGSSVVLSLNRFVFDSAKSEFLKGLNVGDVFSASNLTVGCYNNVNQLSVMRDTTFQAGPAKEITSLGQVTAPASIGKGGTLSVSDVSVAVTYDDTTTGSVHPDRIELDTSTVAESVTGTVYVGDLSATFTIKVVEAPATKDYTISYTSKSDPTGLTSSPNAGNYEDSRKAQWSNNEGLTLTTGSYTNVTKIVLTTSTNANNDAYEISCTVGGVAFGETITMKKGNNMELTFEDDAATGVIVITYTLKGTKKSIYVNSLVITAK